MPRKGAAAVAALPPRLVHRHGDGVRQIQRADLPHHGQAHGGIVPGGKERFGQALGLLPEYQKIALAVTYVAVYLGGLGGKEEKPPLGIEGEQLFDAVVIGDIDILPVIQPRALQILIRHFEPQRADEVQTAARGRAGAGDVARVLRDLRFNQYDVEHTIFSFFSFFASREGPRGKARRLRHKIPQAAARALQKARPYRALCGGRLH